MPTLLINADDLGLHPDIDRGILDCIDAGMVQSVSYSVVGRSIDFNLLKSLQQRNVLTGLHVTLVGERWGTDGRLIANWKSLVKQILTGGKPMRQAVEDEIEWQLRKTLDAGVSPSHIDSHQHVHAFSGVWQPCLAIAERLGIRIRVPMTPTLSTMKWNVGGVALQTLSWLRKRSVPGALPCLGLTYAGHNTAEIFSRELASAEGKDVELVAHPGVNTPDLERNYADWRFDWTGERDALLSGVFQQSVARAGYVMPPVESR